MAIAALIEPAPPTRHGICLAPCRKIGAATTACDLRPMPTLVSGSPTSLASDASQAAACFAAR